MKTIIKQNGYRLIWQDNGSYKVDHVNGKEMPLRTFDLHLAIECFVDWAMKKPQTTAIASGT